MSLNDLCSKAAGQKNLCQPKKQLSCEETPKKSDSTVRFHFVFFFIISQASGKCKRKHNIFTPYDIIFPFFAVSP